MLLTYYQNILYKTNNCRGTFDKKIAAQIRSDLCNIQLSDTHEIFEKAIALFFSKWNNHDNPHVGVLLNHLRTQWYEKLPGWSKCKFKI